MTFKFELVSPERVLVSEDVEQVVLPGAEGDFAVLTAMPRSSRRCAPACSTSPAAGGRKRLLVKGGFAEVDPARLTVLAEQAYDVADLDAEPRSPRELEAAETELAAAKDDEARFAAARPGRAVEDAAVRRTPLEPDRLQMEAFQLPSRRSRH